MKWMKNTQGKPDAMLTFATIGFFVVTLNLLVSTFGSVTVGDTTVQFYPMDSGVMGVYLGATLTAYVSRRYTDKKYTVKLKHNKDDDTDEGV
jgi:hypothetical protein